MCVQIYVCFVPVVKNSIVSLRSPMIMRLGSVGALLRLLATRKFCGESDGAAGANFNFFFKKDTEEFLFLLKRRLCFPG